MPELKIAIQLASLQLPLPQALHTAARLGVQAVEIDARRELVPAEMSQTAVRHLRKMLDDLGLRLAALRFATRSGYGEARGLDRRVDATKEVLGLAYRLGAGVVRNRIGPIPPQEDERTWQRMLDALADVGRHGMHVGATLAAETGQDRPGDLRRVLDALGDSVLGVNLRPADLVAAGEVPLAAVEVLGRAIVYVHAHDAVRGDGFGGGGGEVTLGRGSVELPAVAAALDAIQYRGYFTIERRLAKNPIDEIAQAVEFLRSL